MRTIGEIKSFGAIDAESDKDLVKHFYKSDIIGKVISGEKSIVIGRKGTGKTAIYKYIGEAYKKETVSLDFQHYPWSIHDHYKNSLVSDVESYIDSWEFLFYVEIIKHLIRDKDYLWDKYEKKKIKSLERWLKKNWGASQFDCKENLRPREAKWTFDFHPTICSCSLGGVTKEVEKNVRNGNPLTDYNQRIKDYLEPILNRYTKNVFLIFDRLDLAYKKDDENYINRLTGLLLATYRFHNMFKNVKIVLFLRSDIFNALTFQDKNKIKDNLVEFLDWSGTEEEGGLSLKKLVAIRISNLLDCGTEDFEVCWDALFDKNRMVRKRSKWDYIIDRTFLRPRDVIKMLNLCIDKVDKKCELDSAFRMINDHIYHAELDYSTYLYEELKDEISGKYCDYEYYLEILREVHTVCFDKEEFISKYEVVKKRKSFSESAEIILERLYEFSVIGFYKAGGGGYGGSEYCYKYRSDSQNFNPNAQKFKVHPGFKHYLELIENRNAIE